MVATGQANTRTELAQKTQTPVSTISRRVRTLIEEGLISEENNVSPSGGRPRRMLALTKSDEYALVADIGRHHVRLGTVRPGGYAGDASTIPFDVAHGPEACLQKLSQSFEQLIHDHEGTFVSIGIALPGPVDQDSGAAVRPSSMPGWNGFRVRSYLEGHFHVPVCVDNDANMMALGEAVCRKQDRHGIITVKAGTAIGAGIIVDGNLYRGACGEAGDITHVRVIHQGGEPCSCGNVGCLETVASGAALVRILRAQGNDVETTLDVVELARKSVPEAVMAVRSAGKYLGEVLAVNVNFFNPYAIYLGGVLSTLEPFVAAVRGKLYDNCHPLVTQHLVIEQTRLGVNAGLMGAGMLALEKTVHHDLVAQNIDAARVRAFTSRLSSTL